MAFLQQIGLLTAGAQPWNPNICASKGDRFAYCATLAIYIYQFEPEVKQFQLHSIVTAHKRTVIALRWCPYDNDVIASASSDREILIWNIRDQCVVARLCSIKGILSCIEWFPYEKNTIGFLIDTGPLFTWNFSEPNKASNHLDGSNFLYQVTQFSWNPNETGKLVYGHVDGSISISNPGRRIQKHILRPVEVEESSEDDPVVALEWDPLSTSFLLVANLRNGIRLIDSDSCSVITCFKFQSKTTRIKGLSWIAEAPGMFVSGDSVSGVLRFWSASKEFPILNIKVKKTGFHSLCVVNQEKHDKKHSSSAQEHVYAISSTSTSDVEAKRSASLQDYTIPPCKVVCVFLDGGIGLYNLSRRNWDFLREQGHVETIFDCKFHPNHPNLLATGSFDGTIKVWNAEKLEAVASSPGNESIVYSVSWAPDDLNCIVAATSKNGCFVFDLDKNRITKRFQEHGKHSVYTVAWNQKDSKYIASAGSDGFCVVRALDNSLTKRYKHPGPVFGCDWSSKNRDMLATGCEDKMVRVYYLPTSSEHPIKTFQGHTAKVFHVKWSPLKDGLLCSGSDDSTVRIWDYSQDNCITVLEGHSGPVRGLLWHSELPNILISGSWDHSIRVWDTRTGYCLENNLDHAADVYGLTSHAQRPFVVASCSRDSTLRLWNMVSLVQPLYASLLAGGRFGALLAAPSDVEAPANEDRKLMGSTSQHIKAIIEGENIRDQKRLLQMYAQFFLPSLGVGNFWLLVSIILNESEVNLPENYGQQIVHASHMTMYRSSEAQELETAKANSVFGFAIGTPSKESRLIKAAGLHASLGQLERYCEIMVELGEWDKALAVAPGVSMEYWKMLSERRASVLMNMDSLEAVPHLVASRNVSKLVTFYTERMQLHDALLIAQAAKEGLISASLCNGNDSKHMLSLKNNNIIRHQDKDGDKEMQNLLKQSADNLASWYLRDGQAVHAACTHLAIGDVEAAMTKLLLGNELELAISLGKVFPSISESLHLAIELLSRRCEQMGQWDSALALLRQLPNPEMQLVKFCARFCGKTPAVNHIHTKANLPTAEECLAQGRAHLDKNETSEALKFLIMSSSPEQGLELGLTLIKEQLSKDPWTINNVLPLINLCSCVRTEKLVGKFARLKSELLALASYIGALLAIRREYYSVITPLFSHACQIMAKDKLDLPISLQQMRLESEAYILHRVSAKDDPFSATPLPSDEQKTTWQRMKVKIGEETSLCNKGEYVVTGSHFSSHSQSHISFFTKKKIRGPVFFLEDGFSALSQNDALMWARVNAFSPLGTGLRINPF